MDLRTALFSFHGRMRRRDWWLTTLAVAAGYYLIWSLLGRLIWGDSLAGTPTYAEPIWGDPIGPLALNLALTAVTTWVQTAIGSRRIHDSNRPAWPFMIVNVFTVAVSYAPNDPFSDAGFRDPIATAWTVAYWGSALASLYYLILLGFFDGTRGPNRYGRSPLGIGGDPADESAKVFN